MSIFERSVWKKISGYYLVALDGTGYFASKTIHCASCLHKVHRNGSSTYYHQMLGAAIIHPDVREVIPLMPEPIVKQDGTAKNDCERNAAKRFLVKLRQEVAYLLAADIVAGPLPIRLREVNQSVISTRN